MQMESLATIQRDSAQFNIKAHHKEKRSDCPSSEASIASDACSDYFMSVGMPDDLTSSEKALILTVTTRPARPSTLEIPKTEMNAIPTGKEEDLTIHLPQSSCQSL